IGLIVTAILLGRGTSGPGAHRPAHLRNSAYPRYHAFSGYLFPNEQPHHTRLLDTETGDETLLETSGPERFDMVSCPPWRDATRRYHLAGRLSSSLEGSSDDGSGAVALGMLRSTFPGGLTLDRVGFERIPASPPCWFPDRSDRVLFAGCDGRLYDVHWPGADGVEAPAAAAPMQPTRGAW